MLSPGYLSKFHSPLHGVVHLGKWLIPEQEQGKFKDEPGYHYLTKQRRAQKLFHITGTWELTYRNFHWPNLK
jgi:hypothetical protein